MIKTYGVEITAYGKDSNFVSRQVREFEAAGRTEAVEAVRAWLTVEGYDVTRSVIKVVADGMTFVDHMKRELVNMAARMSLRHGASVEGPFAWEDGNGDPRAAVRLWMANGRGVSVVSKMPEGCLIRSEYGAIRKRETDPVGWVFDEQVQAYPQGTGVGEGFDGDVSALLERIKSLPRK